MSLKEFLLNRINTNGYQSRDELRVISRTLRIKSEFGYDLATCDRKCRELCHEGKIKPVYVNNFLKGYQKPEIKPQEARSEVFKPEPIKDTLKEKIQNPLFKITPTPF